MISDAESGASEDEGEGGGDGEDEDEGKGMADTGDNQYSYHDENK